MKQLIHFPTTFLQFIMLSLIFSVSCAKLPVYESKKFEPDPAKEFKNVPTISSEKAENIFYGVAHNDTNFYLKVIFQHPQNMMKVMRGGLTIYFDPEGKKKKDYQLKIEKTENQDMAVMTQQYGNTRESRMQNMPSMIDLVYTKVTWDANGKEFMFYRNLLKDPICINLGPDEQNQLVLEVKIPIKELPLTEEHNLFSVGIETGSVSAGMTGGPGGSMRPGGSMSSRGGGMPGGGGRSGGGGRGGGSMGGRGGGMRPAGASSGAGSSSVAEPIKLWFQVQL